MDRSLRDAMVAINTHVSSFDKHNPRAIQTAIESIRAMQRQLKKLEGEIEAEAMQIKCVYSTGDSNDLGCIHGYRSEALARLCKTLDTMLRDGVAAELGVAIKIMKDDSETDDER